MDTKHRSLTSRAHQLIREMVLSGNIAPGSRLQIDVLCKRLGMGASPVREALSLLTSERLVERHEQRGFRAPDISATDFSALLETRCRAETLALSDAIAVGDKGWEEHLVLFHYRLNTIDRAARLEEWETVHQEFHAALISACPSRYLLDFCNQLYDLAVRYRNVARVAENPERRISEEHTQIFEATLARNTELAARCLTEHYRRTGDFLHRKLAADEAERMATTGC